jgi:hypothetical protein
MNKFTKRILNAGKFKRNALVVGSGLGYIEQLSEHLRTVFVIDNPDRQIRRRNIVYKDDFTGISTLSEIDFIFLDYNQSGNLEKLQPILISNKATIFIQGEVSWPVNEYKYLRSLGYSHIENNNGMQKWIPS